MCTVTYIPAKNKIFLTSNRDEKSLRRQAVAPKQYTHNGKTIVYPKDADAGGTWVAMHENGNAAILLNGGFVKHIPEPPYRKSRGLIFVDVIAHEMPVRNFLKLDLNNIEPFTLVVFDDTNLFECRWDGEKKHCKQIEKYRPHIWSSVTLYDKEVIQKREQWFLKWLNKNLNPTQQDILHFHQFAGDGDSNNDLRMNRDGMMLTVSVTGIELSADKASMRYVDLKDNMVYRQELPILTSYAL